MVRESNRPILVTGAHRSGTTWTGLILSSAPHVLNVHEPLNVDWPLERAIFPARAKHWFTYIGAENERIFRPAYEHLISRRFSLWAALLDSGIRDYRHIVSGYLRYKKHRNQQTRILIKDPFAVFSINWLVEYFNVHPVILVRHPAAFVSSLMLLKFNYPFDNFIAQPSLMSQLESFRDEIDSYSRFPRPIIDQGVLLWRIIYSYVHECRAARPDWIVVRHEDLSQDPIAHFRDLFCRLDLPLSDFSEAAIGYHSSPDNPGQPKSHIGTSDALRRNSRSNITNWKVRLSLEEVNRIRSGAADVAAHFYGESEW